MQTNSQIEPNLRSGFLEGQIEIPDDFDEMGADEIKDLFEARPTKPSPQGLGENTLAPGSNVIT